MATRFSEELLSKIQNEDWQNVAIELKDWIEKHPKSDLLKEILKVKQVSFIQWFLVSDFTQELTPFAYQSAVQRLLGRPPQNHDTQTHETLLLIFEAMRRQHLLFCWDKTPTNVISNPIVLAIQHKHHQYLDDLFSLTEPLHQIQNQLEQQQHQIMPLYYAMQKMDKALIEKIVHFYDQQSYPLSLPSLVSVAKEGAFEYLISILPEERVLKEKSNILEGIVQKGRSEQLTWFYSQLGFDDIPSLNPILSQGLLRKSEKMIFTLVHFLAKINSKKEDFLPYLQLLSEKEQTQTKTGLWEALKICFEKKWHVDESLINQVIKASYHPLFKENERAILFKQYPNLVLNSLYSNDYKKIISSNSLLYLEEWGKRVQQPENAFSNLIQQKISENCKIKKDFLTESLEILQKLNWRMEQEKIEFQKEIIPSILRFEMNYDRKHWIKWIEILKESGLNLNGFPPKDPLQNKNIHPGGLLHSLLDLKNAWRIHYFLEDQKNDLIQLFSNSDIVYPSDEQLLSIQKKLPLLYEIVSVFAHQKHLELSLPQSTSPSNQKSAKIRL